MLGITAAWYRMENRPKSENGKKLAKKLKMAIGPKWGKNGPKMAKKWDLRSSFYFFTIFGPFFPHFGPIAIFYFLANFFPFSDFGPFSILCQAAWLAGLCQRKALFGHRLFDSNKTVVPPFQESGKSKWGLTKSFNGGLRVLVHTQMDPAVLKILRCSNLLWP